jgi:hypothetical protein
LQRSISRKPEYRLMVFTVSHAQTTVAQINQRLVHSAHTAAMARTSRGHLFLSLTRDAQLSWPV